MVMEYTTEEFARMKETNPEKIQAEYDAIQQDQKAWRERARRVVESRQNKPNLNRMQAFIKNYGDKYIHTGSAKPIFHMMLILGTTGCAIEYFAHHRHHKKGKDNHH